MSTEEQAATCIQARFRGFRWRKLQRRRVSAVTKLQALQRGRFTRREFAELRDFSREQDSFHQATRRRQIRIWRNEQELYFLQHTNAADLERVRAFQQQHSARLIQRCWRAVNNSTTASKGDNEEVLVPSDRVYTFDPFGLRTDHRNQWSHDNESSEPSPLSPLLFINEKELRASASARKLPAAIADDEAFASRRRVVQERIRRKAAQEKLQSDSARKASIKSGTKEGSNPLVNRRRELYEQVVAMKYATAQRVQQYERGSRVSRQDRELLSAQLVKSCENRIKHLQAESLEHMMPSQVDTQLVHDEAEIMEMWDPARRTRAWNHHRRAVCSVLDKRHWWQTQLAGEQRDIRQVVVPKSPWEDENMIWQWPRSENSNQNDHDRACSTTPWSSMEIHRFLVGDKNMDNQAFGPVDDDEASEWWRAHCTQSHLAINGALLIEKPYSAEFSNNITSEGDVFPVCTSEVVANRDLYKLQQRAKRVARTKSLEQDVEQRIKSLVTRVERKVHEMEVQVEANTKLVLEIEQRKVERRARITREQQSAMTIQRYARGMQGRKHAREVRAEFFVMVRGRAIRRGRCEECGDQRAVLECRQCEESQHFCPICWVHVHSTRRRKTHVAIPMTTVVAPISMQEAGSAKVPNLKEPSKTKIVNDDLNSGPKLRALPSPPKQSTTRYADPTEILKKPAADTKLHSSTQDNIRTTTPSGAASTRKNTTPELSEACELARRVRAEVQETASIAENVELVSAQIVSGDIMLSDENCGNDEIDLSSVEGDGAVVTGADNDLYEPKESVETPTLPVTTSVNEQAPGVERVSSLPEPISVPPRSSNDHDLQSGAPTSTKIDTTTTQSLEFEAGSNPELSANTVEGITSELANAVEAAAKTEVASEEVNRDADNSIGSGTEGAAVVSADFPISNDLPVGTGSGEQDSNHIPTEKTSHPS